MPQYYLRREKLLIEITKQHLSLSRLICANLSRLEIRRQRQVLYLVLILRSHNRARLDSRFTVDSHT